MIHIIEGVPGSGKTYYAVHYLIKNFYQYDDFYDEYIEKENKNVLVITNIENLRIKHLNLDVLIERFTLEKFFTVENFERIQKQYKVKNIVIIIDEAQRYFDRKFYDKNVFYFFQYHRHLGVDIFLITQSKNTISKELVVLAEYIVKAIPRSVQPNSFIYHFYDVDGHKLFTKALKRDKNVFRAYSSFKTDELSKPKNVVKTKLIVYGSLFAISVVALFFVLHLFPSFYQTKQVVSSDNVDTSKSVKKQKNEKKDYEASFNQTIKLLKQSNDDKKTKKFEYRGLGYKLVRTDSTFNAVCFYENNNQSRVCYRIEK